MSVSAVELANLISEENFTFCSKVNEMIHAVQCLHMHLMDIVQHCLIALVIMLIFVSALLLN